MTLWRCVVALLLSIQRRGPLLAGCQVFDASLGNVSVEPPSPFALGSDLTVYCHVAACQWRSKITLMFNEMPVGLWKRDTCSPAIFRLSNVRLPLSVVQCTLQKDGQSYLVGGADLLESERGFQQKEQKTDFLKFSHHVEVPPDKPRNVTCATTRQSDRVECSWWRGRDAHIPTSYNVSLSRAQRTIARFNLSQDDRRRLVINSTLFDANETYQLIVTASNHLGAVQSDPFTFNLNDIVVPQSPRIEHVDFGNDSTSAAILRWKTLDPLRHLRASVRLRQANGPWGVRGAVGLGEDAVRVDGLEPLTEYEFQMRTCNSTGQRSLCSQWSPSVTRRSPGKGPSKPLSAWRTLRNHKTSSLQTVTVLWKALPPDQYSGEVEGYQISLGRDPKQEVSCGASLSQCSLQVPADVPALGVSVVTTFGRSPPADVLLTLSGDPGPAVRLLAPVANGSAVLVSWSGTELGLGPRPGRKEKPEYYVTEWTSVPVGELQWQKVTNDKDNITITGLMAGVRYKISLYAVTGRGVSAPSSVLVYSKELVPISGPLVSVLIHKTGRIQIQWDDPAVEQQRGFITNYTVYLRKMDVRSEELSVTLSASGPRATWLDCPEGSLVLQMSASTSAGEGQRGNVISSQPVDTAVGLAALVFTIVVFSAVLVQLLCWRCVRKRMKETCASWLVPSLPKAGNSRAIKLLQLDISEPSFSYTDSDPPLSPLSCISDEDVYPSVPDDEPTTQTSLLETVAMATLTDGYKPQLAGAAQGAQTAELDEGSGEWTEEDTHSGGFGLLVNFLAVVESDSSETHANSRWEAESVVGDDVAAVVLKELRDVVGPRDAVCCYRSPVDAGHTSGYVPQSAGGCSQPACRQ
uniref:interleukin-12 receptor subunit beta-2-like n=1 Tax=Doryrhamphus excisus TaxID=161450 RepID=UPI0025AE7E39|nr:interleukin-12 receptor subunit beta-2-like [Doryrhamphus excisus]